jgi:hypothetical protein
MIAAQNCHLQFDLGFRHRAPTATRTRDLLLRRSFRAGL